MTAAPTLPGELADLLDVGDTIFVQGCSSASDLLASHIVAAGEDLGAMTFTGIQVPGYNRASWLANAQCRFVTFFMTPELRAAGEQVSFLPFGYGAIGEHLRGSSIDAAIFSVAPPDEHGICSFGPTVDFLPELWRNIPKRIAQINPMLPRTSGTPGIPYREITIAVEAETPIREMATPPPDATSAAIARHTGAFVPDGATLQTGLGKLPGAIIQSLTDRRRLRIHSGLIGDGVIDLLEKGAIDSGSDIHAGVAIGSLRLYAALPESGIQFRPVSYTHSPAVLSELPGLVAINSAMAVDLYGQGYAEVGVNGWESGTGGVGDFARGALAAKGPRIVILPSTAKGASRIVAPGAGAGPVSLGRADIDIVVTEHGSADLRGRDHNERAAALVAIAAPEFREDLARAWRDGPGNFHRSQS